MLSAEPAHPYDDPDSRPRTVQSIVRLEPGCPPRKVTARQYEVLRLVHGLKPNRFAEHRHGCIPCAAAAASATVTEEVKRRCREGRRLSAWMDTSHIATWMGPRPPSLPRDTRTYIWSRCIRCGWYACFLEDQQAMEHTMAVQDHARDACAPNGQLPLPMPEP
ncbi:MAG TPA: hypothetical protein VKZ89_22515 [Thermobifida alba]|nr:hypothetical protein [Thermobifida alba]